MAFPSYRNAYGRDIAPAPTTTSTSTSSRTLLSSQQTKTGAQVGEQVQTFIPSSSVLKPAIPTSAKALPDGSVQVPAGAAIQPMPPAAVPVVGSVNWVKVGAVALLGFGLYKFALKRR